LARWHPPRRTISRCKVQCSSSELPKLPGRTPLQRTCSRAGAGFSSVSVCKERTNSPCHCRRALPRWWPGGWLPHVRGPARRARGPSRDWRKAAPASGHHTRRTGTGLRERERREETRSVSRAGFSPPLPHRFPCHCPPSPAGSQPQRLVIVVEQTRIGFSASQRYHPGCDVFSAKKFARSCSTARRDSRLLFWAYPSHPKP
jgi:hypothetical protein